MDQNTDLKQKLTPDEYSTLQQGVEQDNARVLQEGTPNTNTAVQQGMQPRYPNWPTSKPGPMATQPPAGTRPANPLRSEQMVEVGYNQETGEPSMQDPTRSLPDASMQGRRSFDQLETAPAPEGPRRRKERF